MRLKLGLALAALVVTPLHAEDLTIATSVPHLGFPVLRAHGERAEGRGGEARRHRLETYDGQNQTPKQTADVEAMIVGGVSGIVISPLELGRRWRRRSSRRWTRGSRSSRSTGGSTGSRASSAHVGADNVKGGEAQANLIIERFPDGARIVNLQGQPGASPAIDRNQGLHNMLDPVKDKYVIVAEQTANFQREEGASVTEAILAGLELAAGRDRRRQRRHGARRAAGGAGAGARDRDHRLRRAARGAGERARRRVARDDRADAGWAERAARCRRSSTSCATAPSPSR